MAGTEDHEGCEAVEEMADGDSADHAAAAAQGELRKREAAHDSLHPPEGETELPEEERG